MNASSPASNEALRAGTGGGGGMISVSVKGLV